MSGEDRCRRSAAAAGPVGGGRSGNSVASSRMLRVRTNWGRADQERKRMGCLSNALVRWVGVCCGLLYRLSAHDLLISWGCDAFPVVLCFLTLREGLKSFGEPHAKPQSS